MKKNNDFTQEEREILISLEKGEWISDFNKDIKKKYESYARTSISKNKRINIRMSDRDLQKIRVKAMQHGIPYQSLISMLIHKFNEGKIVIK